METDATDGTAYLAPEEEKHVLDGIDRRQDQVETADDLSLRPLIDKIAFDIARGLVRAVKELENHVAGETRRFGESVERRIDSLQIGMQKLTEFAGEQQLSHAAAQDQLHQLTIASDTLREGSTAQAVELESLRTQALDFSNVSARLDATLASLHESSERQARDLAASQAETRTSFHSVAERIDNLGRDLGSQQEDISAAKTMLPTICSRLDALVERLDRQADTVRSLHAAYSQRETELEQIVEGLTRLRTHPRPTLAAEL